MKALYLTCISVFLMLNAYSQKKFGSADGITKSEMKGEFAVQFSETSSKNFWAIDLDQLTTGEKGKFESLVFEDKQLVAVSSPNSENVWYLSTLKTYAIEDVLLNLRTLKEKAKLGTSGTTTKYN